MTDKEQQAPKPTRLAPIAMPDNQFFWDAAKEDKFVGQQCGDCGHYRFPPRPMCPQCHSLNTNIVELSGKAKVVSWIRPRHPMPFGFKELPTVVVVELEEGFRFVSNLEGIAFEDVKADMPVEVFFADTMGKAKVPVFRPAGESA
ncbi:MAG: Zn-ribbon domain-containing OB-fold protein [Oceanococcus sp.]